jgi:hypothetical protein
VRVRTYVFPGDLRGRPGTSARHHPHEPTTSKPVVPGDVLQLSVAAPVICNMRGGEQNRRGSKPLEEPAPSGPRALLHRWRGLTPRWPRSLRLGSASRSKLAATPTPCKGLQHVHPAHSGKKRSPLEGP